ncbi:MAG: rod-binding protein [Alphaproteobacteria bacterium]|nr:rod-binding protein [Alphaproteobacteria bacterium]MCD8570255.1 rod-binding protein [Alphaproteobacteria bacterium]
MTGTLTTPDTTLALLKATESQSTDNVKKLKASRQLEKIADASQEFEAVFIAEMMKPMFEELKTDGLFGGGKGEEVFRSLLLQEYGKLTASTGKIGIADAVKNELIKMQEEQKA